MKKILLREKNRYCLMLCAKREFDRNVIISAPHFMI